MAGAWINHVKATYKKMEGSYKDAMKAAAKTWKSKAGKKKNSKKKKRMTTMKRKIPEEQSGIQSLPKFPYIPDVSNTVNRSVNR